MARPIKPLQVIMGNNNSSHLTKAEIKERKDSQIKVDNDKVKSPGYLPKELKREFKKLADELLKADLIANLDVDLLARYLILRQEFIKISDVLHDEPIMLDEILDENGKPQVNTNYGYLLNNQTKLTKEIRGIANDLGLSLGARLKLIFPKTEETKKKTTTGEKMFGDII